MTLVNRVRTLGALALLCAIGFLTVAGSAHAALPASWYKGANLDSWWYNEWESTSTNDAIQALRATNSTDAMFVVTWYMANKTSSTVAPDPLKTPSDAGLLRAMAYAKSLGMRVELKLHVDVMDGTFRADIAPASPALWFQTYASMLSHYAALARQAGADLLVVGTELTSMSSYTDQWRSLIAMARAEFPGRLTFAANWIAGASQIKFWDALDFIGVDGYMPVSDTSNPDPTVTQLVGAWAPYVQSLGTIVSQYGKPAIFTEIGYQSEIGTAVTPWWTTGAVSQTAQQNAYEAVYRVWSQVPWFAGVFWWDWRPAGFSPSDGQFSPRGKLAAQTMTAWNQVAPPVTPPPVTPPPVTPPPVTPPVTPPRVTPPVTPPHHHRQHSVRRQRHQHHQRHQ